MGTGGTLRLLSPEILGAEPLLSLWLGASRLGETEDASAAACYKTHPKPATPLQRWSGAYPENYTGFRFRPRTGFQKPELSFT